MSKFGNNKVVLCEDYKSKIHIHIEGENNVVDIRHISPTSTGDVWISLVGNNCSILIDAWFFCRKTLKITMGQNHPKFGKIHNSHLHISKGCSVEELSIITFNSNAKIFMGESNMISYGVTMYHTDAHPIYDVNSKKIINIVKEIRIGNRNWIGANSTILKNVTIGDDNIIGYGSIVSSGISKKESVHNCIIAGNPAKVVREGVFWEADGSKGYVQNENL